MTANTPDAETHNLSALLTVQGRRGSEKLLKECPISPGNFMLPEIIWKIVKNVLQDRWRQDGRKREDHMVISI